MQNFCMRRFVLLFVSVLAFSLSCLAQAEQAGILSNADVARMVKAGLPESIILRKIQMSGTDFSTTPAALIQLKKQGASERVLGAVLDSRGAQGSYPEPPTNVEVTAQGVGLHLHRMPSFEADLQVNAKTRDKVTVGKNHIEVKQAGVPVFSLKWRVPNQGK
jgi:hypothetical protein